MSERFSISALRAQAETAEPNTCPADALLALVEAVEALNGSGWNDADGKCWCERATEVTGRPHIDRCQRAREALSRFDFGVQA